jgi:hypothetical protein
VNAASDSLPALDGELDPNAASDADAAAPEQTA